MANPLTETAFTLPVGGGVKVPRWLLLGAVGGLIIILLLVKKGGATSGETAEEGEEESGSGAGSWLDDLIEEINQDQGPVETPGIENDPPETVYTEQATPRDNATASTPTYVSTYVDTYVQEAGNIDPALQPFHGYVQEAGNVVAPADTYIQQAGNVVVNKQFSAAPPKTSAPLSGQGFTTYTHGGAQE